MIELLAEFTEKIQAFTIFPDLNFLTKNRMNRCNTILLIHFAGRSLEKTET